MFTSGAAPEDEGLGEAVDAGEQRVLRHPAHGQWGEDVVGSQEREVGLRKTTESLRSIADLYANTICSTLNKNPQYVASSLVFRRRARLACA